MTHAGGVRATWNRLQVGAYRPRETYRSRQSRAVPRLTNSMDPSKKKNCPNPLKLVYGNVAGSSLEGVISNNW